MLFVVSGPSGCGKSTLIRKALEELDNIFFSVSHTTRKKRPGECEGKEYFFVSKPEFGSMVKANKFIEWADVHGNLYGTSRKELEAKGAKGDLILDLDVQGARQVMAKFKKAKFIFVLPPNFRTLRKRIEKRAQDSPASIERRLEAARREVRGYPEFHYVIINDELERAADELKSIIVATRCLLDSRKKELAEILLSFSEG